MLATLFKGCYFSGAKLKFKMDIKIPVLKNFAAYNIFIFLERKPAKCAFRTIFIQVLNKAIFF